jgi:hypothetical protein
LTRTGGGALEKGLKFGLPLPNVAKTTNNLVVDLTVALAKESKVAVA